MTDRILDISEAAADLRVRYGQLIVKGEGDAQDSIPLDDLAVLVVAHPQVTFSQAVLCGLVERGGAFVVCNERRLPVGMLLPLDAHYVQTERFARQAALPLPRCKRLWQQLVRAKVLAQAALLRRLRGDDAGLAALAARIRSGDPANVEAQASRRYWPALFGPDFRRDPDADDHNRHLNYGYAVLRAMAARAVCAAGLHPSLGIHHHNRYNTFCLADDLMEPFRPLVDEAVAALVAARGADAPLDRDTKAALLAGLTRRVRVRRQECTVFQALARAAASLAAVVMGNARGRLVLPDADQPTPAGQRASPPDVGEGAEPAPPDNEDSPP